VAAYLATLTNRNTARAYQATLTRLVDAYGPDVALEQLACDPDRLAELVTTTWGQAAPRTWNLRLTTLRSAVNYWTEQGWLTTDPTVRLRPRSAPPDRDRALTRDQVAALLARTSTPLTDRVLWTLLYESACRAQEALALDVEDLDLPHRRARVRRKGGARDIITWQTSTARLLPRLLAGRRHGPVFLTQRRAKPSVALADVDPTTGRARLSYRRAAERFEAATMDLPGGPWTLHQLRHSALTHAAEEGASTPLLMAYSGHTSVRSLAKYARISAEALARWQADRDPARRR